MPIKPPPPSSPTHNLQQQQGGRSPVPSKNYAPISSSPSGRGGRTSAGPLQQNNQLINNSPQQQHNSSPQQNSATNQSQLSPSSNNNQLQQSQTGNGNTPPNSRAPLLSAETAGGVISKGGDNTSPNLTSQTAIVSPKVERYSSMNTGDRIQAPAVSNAATNETGRHGMASSAKQQSLANTTSSANYQGKLSGGNSNNASADQSPTLKRPRKGSGGVHSKHQQAQPPQTSHHGSSHIESVSSSVFQYITSTGHPFSRPLIFKILL